MQNTRQQTSLQQRLVVRVAAASMFELNEITLAARRDLLAFFIFFPQRLLIYSILRKSQHQPCNSSLRHAILGPLYLSLFCGKMRSYYYFITFVQFWAPLSVACSSFAASQCFCFYQCSKTVKSAKIELYAQKLKLSLFTVTTFVILCPNSMITLCIVTF